ncbi:transposase [Streptomyces californicus]|uniref:transposase n=1 Tax=Streptomyces californicus TaxID=67351 RepID=UPI0033CC9C13
MGEDRAVATGPTPRQGGRWRDHRQIIDAIVFRSRTGTPWMDLPGHFGSWKGAPKRLLKWVVDGTWEKVFTALLAQADAEGCRAPHRRHLHLVSEMIRKKRPAACLDRGAPAVKHEPQSMEHRCQGAA